MATNQTDFEKYLVTEYFKLGSINKVFTAHHLDLPISFAGYARLLDKYHIIKSAGPNSRFSESLDILTKLSSYKIPLEKVYHRFAPRRIQVSINTLHRILHYTRLGLTRRQGTALLITKADETQSFLTGREQNTPNSLLGRKGDLALPMGHSKTGETPRDAIARVLQQEVFTSQTIEGHFPWELVPEHPHPVMYINIADIKVTVYHLIIPKGFQFSSFKLNSLKFRSFNELMATNLRPGIADILVQHTGLIDKPYTVPAPEFNSQLNLALLKVRS